jgi:death-on-curing protein
MRYSVKMAEDPKNPPALVRPELLESALSAPTEGAFGEDFYKGLFTKTAAMCYRIAKNHPFDDGNKRVAFATLRETLEINGYPLDWNKQTAVTTISLVATDHLDIEGLRHVIALSCGFHPSDILP